MKYILVFFLLLTTIPSYFAQEINIGEVDKRDTLCFTRIEQAKKDFSKNLITYTFFHSTPGESPMDNRFIKELKELLLADNIYFKDYYSSDLVIIDIDSGRKREDCYESAMNKLIDLKYGEKFINDKKAKADTLYVLNHINDVFDEWNCDSRSRNKQFYDDLETTIIYPKEFNHNEDKYSYSMATFIIDKNGKISDLEIKTEFKNTDNNTFKPFFEKQILDLIRKTKWESSSARGVKVNSLKSVFYAYK